MQEPVMESDFDEEWYLRRYPDVAVAIALGKTPSALAHYEQHGRAEGRQPSAPPGSADLNRPARKSYQTFPGEEGDSDSEEKLRRLKLPSFSGKSVLDVGCNEGFFCFEAAVGGATRVVGVDSNPEFIARAQARRRQQDFSGDLEFRQQAWDNLSDEKFDIILFLSALHYADDQSAIMRSLLERLTPQGLLVLECGIFDEEQSALIPIKRANDVVSFPTLGRMKEWLAPYAWKLIGTSVQQLGDPVPRQVFHIRIFKREILLLLGFAYSGKTTLARTLAESGIPSIMVDDHIRIYHKTRLDDSKLAGIVRKHYDGQRLDYLYKQIVVEDALDELTDDIVDALDVINARISVVEGALGEGDTTTRDQIARRMEARGYFVWLCSRR